MSLVQAPGGVLPASTSEFIGRETELDRLGALLDGDARLVTLVGPGGIGKTRLAAEGLRRGVRARRRPVSSIRTVDAQVAAIRQKLMISSRADIVGHIPEELVDRVRYESERRPRRARKGAHSG
ncbi:AAA family ATPase [Nocardia sp. 2YAB30]|uniref:AAA family ATPase n=1 Tax=unclassified Nocardia TaxID=2637762 RepID=UPI003F97DF94